MTYDYPADFVPAPGLWQNWENSGLSPLIKYPEAPFRVVARREPFFPNRINLDNFHVS